jgi:uncharacterized phiE125 gp8 family phage protein
MPINVDPIPAMPDDPNYRQFGWTVTVPPTDTPVEWSDAMAHLRLDTTTDQSYVEMLITAATSYAEERMSIALMPRTILATFYPHEWAWNPLATLSLPLAIYNRPLVLPRTPLIEILSVTDAAGNLIDPSNYRIDHRGYAARVWLQQQYLPPVTIIYQAGYANADAIPMHIKLGILQHVATMYEQRESVTEKTVMNVPQSLDAFYNLHSRDGGIG